jgi:hypothetical protein
LGSRRKLVRLSAVSRTDREEQQETNEVLNGLDDRIPFHVRFSFGKVLRVRLLRDRKNSWKRSYRQ